MIRNTMIIAIGIQIGPKTNHQLQSIFPVNFKTTKTIVNTSQKLMLYLLVVELFIFILYQYPNKCKF